MKKIFKNITLILVLGISLFVANSCDNPLVDEETGEDIALLIVDPDVFDTKLALHLQDEQGNYLMGTDLMVGFMGGDAEQIIGIDGKRQQFFETTNGILQVAVDPAYQVSKTNPLELTIYAADNTSRWISIPYDVYLVREGNTDIIIRLNEMMNEKSANISPNSHFGEPFDITVNGEPFDKIATPRYAQNQYENGIFRYGMYTFPRPGNVQGSITYNFECSEFPAANSIDGYGVRCLNGPFSSTNCTNEQPYQNTGYLTIYEKAQYSLETSGDPLGNSVGHVLCETFANMVVTGYKGAELETCLEGLNIELEMANGASVNEKFNYKLYFNQNNEDVMLCEGLIGGEGSPSVTNTGRLIYPKSVSELKLVVENTDRYEFTPSQVSISTADLCDKTIKVTATPADALKPYRIMAELRKADDPEYKMSPSAIGLYSEMGTSQSNFFYMFAGNSDVGLKSKTDYIFMVLANNEFLYFNISTDPSSRKNVIETNLQRHTDLEKLDINYSDIQINNMPVTQIRVDATYSGSWKYW